MGQCSKWLLCHLIGKAERGAAHTKNLDEKMMALCLLLRREGTRLLYMFFSPLPLCHYSLFRYRPSFSAMKGHKVGEYQKNP